jgi:predicted GTPase
MINGFDIETAPLSEYERVTLLPIFVRALIVKVGEQNAVTNKTICEKLKKEGYKIGDARVRKIINHIRINGLVHMLIATSKGYFVADKMDQAISYRESLRQRISAIEAVHDSLDHQIQLHRVT